MNSAPSSLFSSEALFEKDSEIPRAAPKQKLTIKSADERVFFPARSALFLNKLLEVEADENSCAREAGC